MSDKMPEYMSDRMSEYMSDKLSEYIEYIYIYNYIYIYPNIHLEMSWWGSHKVKYFFSGTFNFQHFPTFYQALGQ